MPKFILLLVVALFNNAVFGQNKTVEEKLALAISYFEENYRSLNLPPLSLDFKNNLRFYGNTEQLEAQQHFFSRMQTLLAATEKGELTPRSQFHFAILQFETDLQLERISHLAKEGSPESGEETSRLSDLKDGAFWYRWFLQKWTGTRLAPEEIIESGMVRIKEVNQQLAELKAQIDREKPLSEKEFFIRRKEKLQTVFKERKEVIRKNLSHIFPEQYYTEFSIEQGKDESLAQTPGYYFPSTHTFYYNLFEQPFRAQDVDWLLMHEAVPGHHFQLSIARKLELPRFRNQLQFPGYSEGWAAYAEQYGKEISLYQTLNDDWGALRWNIVRAVRMVLDVRLNADNWPEEQALEFWKTHIPDQDEIALREIKRMQRWPAQVQTYVVGSMLIEQKRDQLKQQQGANFNLKEFHTKVLELGPIPMGILEEVEFQ